MMEKNNDLIQLINQEKELDNLRRKKLRDEQLIDDLQREKNNLIKKLSDKEEEKRKQTNLMKMKDHVILNLEHENEKMKNGRLKMIEIVSNTEKQRNSSIRISEDLTLKVITMMEEAKSKENELMELKKSLAVVETKLKQTENLYHAALMENERNLKENINIKKELEETKQKHKGFEQDVKELSKSVKSKDEECEEYCAKLREFKETMINNEKYLMQHKNKGIMYADKMKELENQGQIDAKGLSKYERELKESRLGCAQLQHRQNIEREKVTALNEKISSTKKSLEELNKRNQQAEIKIKEQTITITKLELENRSYESKKQMFDECRKKINELEKANTFKDTEILRLKIGMQSLKQRIENPKNVHQWRILKKNKSTEIELVEKINALRKLLVNRSQESAKRRLLSVDLEVQDNVTKPGEVSKKFQTTLKKKLFDKDIEIKCLRAEIQVLKATKTIKESKDSSDLAKSTQV